MGVLGDAAASGTRWQHVQPAGVETLHPQQQPPQLPHVVVLSASCGSDLTEVGAVCTVLSVPASIRSPTNTLAMPLRTIRVWSVALKPVTDSQTCRL